MSIIAFRVFCESSSKLSKLGVFRFQLTTVDRKEGCIVEYSQTPQPSAVCIVTDKNLWPGEQGGGGGRSRQSQRGQEGAKMPLIQNPQEHLNQKLNHLLGRCHEC